MRFDEMFEMAGGSVSGRSHVVAGKPNQDALAFRATSSGICAIVCDGCGSGMRSEVGAALGARIICEQAIAQISAGNSLRDEKTWARIRQNTLEALAALLRVMGEPASRIVTEYFLFTAVGMAISLDGAVVFGIGDGLWAMNGEISQLGPFPGNAPPYLGYGLLGDGPGFTIHRECAVDDFETGLVATDGAIDYCGIVGHSYPGGRGEFVRQLATFWQDDKYFQNEDALRRTLWLVNREVTRPVWNEKRLVKEPGLLEDDTTLLVVRKKKSLHKLSI